MSKRRRSRTRRGVGLMYSDEAFDRAAEELGTTDNPYAAGYILPDGSLLDMSLGQGERIQDHREIEGFMEEEYPERWQAMVEFMRRGAIRMQMNRDDELFLDIVRRPTDAQDEAIRDLISWARVVHVDVTDPRTGVVDIWNEWGSPSGKRIHPGAVVRWMDETGMRGLGRVAAPERTKEIFHGACKQIGGDWQDYEPHDSAFILPDGCLVKLSSHENIASYYPEEIMDTFMRGHEAVSDFIERGAIRTHWDGDLNAISFEFHKKPTSTQKRIVREMSSWADQVYIDVQEEAPRRSVIEFDVIPIFSKSSAGKVVRYMNEKGFGQRVARPAGTPRGRLKFHWNPGAFLRALEVAEDCSGPIRKVCKTERHRAAGQLTTCTWRDSSGRIVAGASGRERDMEDLEEGTIGRSASLWTDRDLLDGRCPR